MRYVFFIIITLLFISCAKKELPPDMEEDVVFYWKGFLQNDPFFIPAGKYGYYFVSELISQSDEKIYVASFENEYSNESLTIKFFTAPTSTTQQVFIPRSFPISENTIATNAYTFKALPSGTSPFTYNWNFGDGHTSSQADPIHTYQNPGSYIVKLSIKDNNNCTDSFENIIDTDMTNCSGNFTYSISGVTTAQFQSNTIDPLTTTYFWSFGDGTSSNLAAPQHQYNSFGVYRVCLTLSNGPACQTTYCQKINIGQSTQCVTNFSYSADSNLVIYPYVVVEYSDEAGKRFSSSINSQPLGNNFNIITVEDYENDGELYYKLNIENSIRLFDEQDPQNSISLSGKGAIAVKKI